MTATEAKTTSEAASIFGFSAGYPTADRLCGAVFDSLKASKK